MSVNTRFLIFTKKYKLVNDYLRAGGVIPENMTVVLSAWGAGWPVPNPFNLPEAHVLFNNEEMDGNIPEYAIRNRKGLINRKWQVSY